MKTILALVLVALSGFSDSAHAMDIKEISDRLSIEDTLITLFIKTDEKDWTAVQGVFTPQVDFDMSSLAGPKKKMTPGEITALWQTGLKNIPIIHHQPGNFRFNIQGDKADAHCYGIAFHYKPTSERKKTRVFVGTYDFHLTRADGGWKIDSFRYNSQFVEGNLKLEKAK